MTQENTNPLANVTDQQKKTWFDHGQELRFLHKRTINAYLQIGRDYDALCRIVNNHKASISQVTKEIWKTGEGKGKEIISAKDLTASRKLANDLEIQMFIREYPAKIGRTTNPQSLITAFNKHLKDEAKMGSAEAIERAVKRGLKIHGIKEVKTRKAPKENAPKENAPKENAPKENAPKENAPKENAPTPELTPEQQEIENALTPDKDLNWKSLAADLINDVLEAIDNGEVKHDDAKEIARMFVDAKESILNAIRPLSKSAESTK